MNLSRKQSEGAQGGMVLGKMPFDETGVTDVPRPTRRAAHPIISRV
jgi:hypothetical protein